jgi:hypothetical protein
MKQPNLKCVRREIKERKKGEEVKKKGVSSDRVRAHVLLLANPSTEPVKAGEMDE